MIKKIISASLCVIILFCSFSRLINPNDTIKIMFIGNSLTYVPQIPEQLKLIATSKNKKIVCQSKCEGDYTLENHWNEMSPDFFLENKFDYVVLQEHGLPPVADIDNFFKYAKLFNDKIKESGAKTILYITSRSANEEGVAVQERQSDLTTAYETAAKQTGALLAPSGPSWIVANEENPTLKFYQDDNLHPNMLGGYLTACVLYSVIFNESPLGADSKIIRINLSAFGKNKETILKYLQNTAWETTENYKPLKYTVK